MEVFFYFKKKCSFYVKKNFQEEGNVRAPPGPLLIRHWFQAELRQLSVNEFFSVSGFWVNLREFRIFGLNKKILI